MKVTPVQGPVTQSVAPNAQAQADAKARAVAMLTNQTAAVNQSAVAPEETRVASPTVVTPETTSQPETQPEVKEEARPTDPLSSQYAVLARKEKALRAKAQQQDQTFRQREEQIKGKEAEFRAQIEQELRQKYDKDYIPKSKFKENTLGAIADAGLTYEEITQKQIEAGEVNPSVKAYIERLEARQAALERSLEEGSRKAQEQQGEAYKAAINQIKQDATALVKSNPEYETIKATGSVKDVVDLIEMTFKEEGRVMDVEEAADLVEQHLVEEIDKLTKIEKIKKRLNPGVATQETAQKQSPTQTKQPQPMKTLTNATSSTRTLSAKERAILAFRGELKD